MATLNILTLVGGISRTSLNKKLYTAFKELEQQVNCELQQLDISQLPYFNQDLEDNVPVQIQELKHRISRANGILIITPEYNRSFPGVLKNAIDWASRPYGENSWDQKCVAILGASVGNIGTFGAQHHLRQVFSYLNTYTMGQPEVYFNGAKAFNEKGVLIDNKSAEILLKFFTAFKTFIRLHSIVS